MTPAEIIDEHTLSFDPNDPLNGSLYLCLAPSNAQAAATLIDELRLAGLWSSATPKTVAEGQKGAYKEQLRFVEAVRYRGGPAEFVIARFDHPKFPSDEGRFNAWKAAFGDRYTQA